MRHLLFYEVWSYHFHLELPLCWCSCANQGGSHLCRCGLPCCSPVFHPLAFGMCPDALSRVSSFFALCIAICCLCADFSSCFLPFVTQPGNEAYWVFNDVYHSLKALCSSWRHLDMTGLYGAFFTFMTEVGTATYAVVYWSAFVRYWTATSGSQVMHVVPK